MDKLDLLADGSRERCPRIAVTRVRFLSLRHFIGGLPSRVDVEAQWSAHKIGATAEAGWRSDDGRRRCSTCDRVKVCARHQHISRTTSVALKALCKSTLAAAAAQPVRHWHTAERIERHMKIVGLYQAATR
jgi:hypothetical protein